MTYMSTPDALMFMLGMLGVVFFGTRWAIESDRKRQDKKRNRRNDDDD